MGRPAGKLEAKHYKALQLLESDELSIKEVARVCNMKPQYLYDLTSGREKAGQIGKLFKAEMDKIHQRNGEKIKPLLHQNKRMLLSKTAEWLRDNKDKKVDDKHLRKLCMLMNSMAKMSPTVSIETGDINILTTEERLVEFRRLKEIARANIAERGGIPVLTEGSPGGVLDVTPTGSGFSEDSESSEVPAS